MLEHPPRIAEIWGGFGRTPLLGCKWHGYFPTNREGSDSDSEIIFEYPDVLSDIEYEFRYFGYNMGNIRRISDIQSDNLVK